VQSFQTFAPAVLAAAIRRQPASAARTAFAWSVAAGPALARAASVEARDGVLWVTPKDTRWSREIERSSATLLARVQTLLGSDEVKSLRICVKP
jgi:predicted nucleic acid-binding Zn ribbon protein